MAEACLECLARFHAVGWGRQDSAEFALPAGSVFCGPMGEFLRRYPDLHPSRTFADAKNDVIQKLLTTHTNQLEGTDRDPTIDALRALRAAMRSLTSTLSRWVDGVLQQGQGINTVIHGDPHAWSAVGWWGDFGCMLAQRRRIVSRYRATDVQVALRNARFTLGLSTHHPRRRRNFMWSVDPKTQQVGEVRLVDLQSVSRGVAALDVLYFIKQSCGTAEYDEHLRLLRLYHESLVAAGVGGYSFDALSLDYARCFLATFQFGGGVSTSKHSSDKRHAGTVAHIEKKIADCESGAQKWKSKWETAGYNDWLWKQQRRPINLRNLVRVRQLHAELLSVN